MRHRSNEVSMRIEGSWAVALLLALTAQAASTAQSSNAAQSSSAAQSSNAAQSSSTAQAPADDPCAGFKWDVSRERALFASAGATVPAGKDRASAPGVVPNHLYRIVLLPASQVAFPVTPGKTSPADGTYAGVFALTVPTAGKYRVAIDAAFWIDVAANGKLVPASDYEGRHDCSAPRKIVEFVLDGKAPWVLQLSGASQAAVRLTITPASSKSTAS
jgi:hypothetical protein